MKTWYRFDPREGTEHIVVCDECALEVKNKEETLGIDERDSFSQHLDSCGRCGKSKQTEDQEQC